MLRLAILIFLVLFFDNSASAEAVPRLSDLLPGNARWSLVVVEVKTGKELVEGGNVSREPLLPGSLVKLVTAGAVLENKLNDLKTCLCSIGNMKNGVLKGDLCLRGGGNAFLTAADLESAAARLSGLGLKRITGDIIADDTLFATKGLERKRKGAGYAPPGSLGLDLHTVAISVSPTEVGKPPQVTVEPHHDGIRPAVSAMTTNTESATLRVIQLDDNSYRMTGNIPANSAPLKWRFALEDPALSAGAVFKSILNREGIEVQGEVRKGAIPADAKTLLEIPGPPLPKMLGDMNFHSLNVVADNLLLALGAEKDGAPGTREKGLGAVTEFLAALDLPMDEVKIADGSGLSGDNRVTARVLVLYLAKVAGESWFGGFYNSLPRAGMEGTLANVGYRNEKFRVKTGILEDVFALAGYGVDGSGRDIAFAYIVNVPGGGVMNLERSGAEVIRFLAEAKSISHAKTQSRKERQ